MLELPAFVPSFRTSAGSEDVLAILRRTGPATVSDLLRAAKPPRGSRRAYRLLLKRMLADGEIVLDARGRLGLPEETPLVRPRRARRQGRGPRPPRSGPGGARAAHRHETRAGAGHETPARSSLIARFEGHPDGFGFVNPPDGARDVFIPPRQTGHALHGDLVEYRIVGRGLGGRREGAVIRVVRPTGQRIVGLVTAAGRTVEVTPFDPRAGARLTLPRAAAEGLDEGTAVVIEIGRGRASREGTARLVEILGPLTHPGVDIEVLIRKHQLRVEFPADVLRETAALAAEIPKEELRKRHDFSGDAVFTIDGETAKDFDDAIGVTPARGGGCRLAVHIADVAHYVRPGSRTDIEARLRGTSVYFPGRAIPMLPPALSENLCSLRQDLPRLVQSVLISFDAEGAVREASFEDGWIRSRARLTYGRVNALLDGAPPEPAEKDLLPDLGRMSELASRLASRRAARGGLDFDLPEPEVVLDALGAAAGIKPVPRGPAQRMIEEFMIAANRAVARCIGERQVGALHRVHEPPDPTKVAELARVARSFGHRMDVDPDLIEPSAFRSLLERIAGRPEERSLSRLVLRTMALARYSPDPLGHFGLAAPDYIHFTSPIRRYPDLVAHRALRLARGVGPEDPAGAERAPRGAAGRRGARRARSEGRAEVEAGRRAPAAAAPGRGRRGGSTEEDLDALGVDCSRLERGAESAERESLAWKRAEVLMGWLGERMTGTVASVGLQGVFVELDEVYAEGLVPISALAPDRYEYDPRTLTLRGERRGHSYRAGQRLEVLVARVDRIAQRVELALPGSTREGSSDGPAGGAEYGRAGDGRRRARARASRARGRRARS